MSQTPKGELELLRGYELRLLRCTLSPPLSPISEENSVAPSQTHPIHALIEHLVNAIEGGDYHGALSWEGIRQAFQLSTTNGANSMESANEIYSELQERVEQFVVHDSVDEADRVGRAVFVMCIAVAAIFGFNQCNMTGPLKELPKCPLPLEAQSNSLDYVEWDNWARNQLMSAGSDLLGKCSHLQYIVYAKTLLMKTRDLLSQGYISASDSVQSLSWWLARVILLQQRTMDERSSSLLDLFQVFINESLHHFGTLEGVSSYWGSKLFKEDISEIVSMIHLEAGIGEYTYGRADYCSQQFDLAEVASGLQLSVTGALGFRTAHQVEAKAQMVLITDASALDNNESLSVSPKIRSNGSSTAENYTQSLHEASDILMTPKLLDNNQNSSITFLGLKDGGYTSLRAIQQAVVLAKCLLIEKSSRQDEMQRWDMAPYIEAIDSQQSSYFVIQSLRDILRIRWELTRNRTKERALLMMENQVKSIYEPSPGVAERMIYCFGVHISTIPALRKEYGELLVRCGLVGEALKIFEELELWDSLIYCYRLLEKKAAAVELIKTRLSLTQNDPRLWCSLGDVTNDDTCYKKALEVSGNKSARAKRSLARSAYNRGEYEKSMILWESALALNSLYPDGWFALGAAALKARKIEKAVDGFTRAVQLDPDNGEAWNNIACLHMIKKKSKESFIAFREALKFKRNSWQLWENFSQVALDVGNISQAMEAIQMVLDLTSCKKVDTELLQKITEELEKRAEDSGDQTEDAHLDSTGQSCIRSLGGKSRETEQLIDTLGKLLQKIIRSGSQADIWGLYARWHKMKGDLSMCAEALLKQVRSYQGSDVWRDEERFKKFAHISLELCKVYMEISTSMGSRRELFSAEMHLKSTIKQAVNFTNTEEFKDLEAYLTEVQKKVESLDYPA
ncbi:hypothetical protein SAY87_005701 [Trapa incisa]|uniref:Tetratricopeptide repeat protein 27 homolog n=1 Tax=Trapa incisa TaxID=236973 RepID=A0AAN7KAA5_9MYRT|nr:hypothetical protein SAY87_005701 [Trapa incisa]